MNSARSSQRRDGAQSARSARESLSTRRNTNLYDRSMHWQSIKDSKIHKMKKEEKRYEVKDASFRPDLCSYKPVSSVNAT